MISFLIYFVLVSLQSFAHEHHDHDLSEMRPHQPVLSASIYNLKDEWNDQNGKRIKLKELAGNKVIVAMVYLGCKSTCPILTADMKSIAHHIPTSFKDKPHFVLVSIDPKRDTVTQLKSFATKNKFDSNWTLLTGDGRGVRELAAALGVQYKQDKNGEFRHSNTITLLDDNGVIQVQVQGLGADPSELLKRL
jgi:protein SCO1